MVAKIMLVDPPTHHLVSQFVGGVYWYPSLAVSYLKSVLSSANVESDCRHWNGEFHNFLADELDVIEPEDAILSLYSFSSMLFPKYYRRKGKKILKIVRNVVRENKDYEFDDRLTFFESEVEDWVNKWTESIKWIDYKLVGISAVTLTQLIPGLYLAKSIKSVSPNTLTVFGGFACHGNFGARLIEIFDQIDVVADGEGELIVKDLANTLEGTLDLSSVKGIVHRHGETVVRNPPQPLIADLSSLPFPDYGDYPNSDKIEELLIEMGRGCPWGKCVFCTSMTSKGYRFRPAERVFQELLYESDKHKTRRFVFVDLDILGNARNLEKLCDLLIAENRDFDLFAEACAEKVTKPILEKMSKAGFRRLQVGFETFSNPLLRKMQKDSKAIDNIKVLKWGKELGTKITGNIIVGFPGETVEDLKKSLQVMRSCNHLIQYVTTADFNLNYGSTVYTSPKEYGVTVNLGARLNNFSNDEIARLMFGQDIFPWLPDKMKDSILQYFYSFKQENEDSATTRQLFKFRNIIDESLSKWQSESPGLEYYDMKTFLQIRDERTHRLTKFYTLEANERDVFMLCENVQTLEMLHKTLPHLSRELIKEKLDLFMKHELVYGDEDEKYINLATRAH
nr:radical SAM protein [Candidatus Njordarchaeota archaeon]